MEAIYQPNNKSFNLTKFQASMCFLRYIEVVRWVVKIDLFTLARSTSKSVLAKFSNIFRRKKTSLTIEN